MSILISITGSVALLALAALFSACAYYALIRAKQAKIDTAEELKRIQRAQDDEDDMMGV